MFKNKIFISVILAALLIGGLITWGLTGVVTKGTLGKEDLRHWFDAGETTAKTYTRETSTAYSMTLHKFDWVGVDILQVYGAGLSSLRTKATIDSAVADIGAVNKTAMWLSPGTWTIGANADYSAYANITWVIPPGCLLSHGAFTLKIAGPIVAGPYQIFSGAGTVTLSSDALELEYDDWDDDAGQGIITPRVQENIGGTLYRIPNMLQIKGLVIRPKFAYKDADEISMTSGSYHHEGTVEQIVYWTSQIDFEFESTGSNSDSTDFAANDIFYIYLDDSAIVGHATNLLVAADFLAVTEEPVWSSAKNGWYGSAAAGNATADDKCIMSVYVDATPDLAEFSHDGDFVLYGKFITDVAAQDVDNAWVDASSALTIPKFATKAQVTFHTTRVAADPSVSYWRTNGVTGATANDGHVIAYVVDATPLQGYNTCNVITDSNQLLELYHTNSNASTTSIHTDGWYFPAGM